ncbi:hypothetical protein I4U23_023591 [Adineta vaga]|nr:hypothetical protein I4U23_023591 [Adineta vaga]
MADCYACRKPLHCSWYVYTIDSSYFEATKCFDISDGYLLCAISPDWVFCFCDLCWHRYTVNLSSIIHIKQINALKEQNNLLQQQLTVSEQMCIALREQLFVSNTESSSIENQMKLVENSEVTKLREFLKQLTKSQIDALQIHTDFRIDTFDNDYNELLSECSSKFVTSIITKLSTSINEILRIEENLLIQRKQMRETIFETLSSTDLSKETIDASTILLDKEIEKIQIDIQTWNTFIDTFMDDSKKQQQQSVLMLFLKQNTS